MSDSLLAAMRRSGAALAEMGGAEPPAPPLRWGAVQAVAGTRLTVAVAGASLSLPMTGACSGAKAGDRCVVASVGAQAVVLGIIAR